MYSPYSMAERRRMARTLVAWRLAAWSIAVLCVLLWIALGVSRLALEDAIERCEQMDREATDAFVSALNDLADAEREVSRLRAQVEALESRPEEERFLACRTANEGLVEGIREQQALIRDAIDALAQCGSRTGVTYAAR